MKDNWINHNTDKLLLFIALILSGYMVMHIIHHDTGDMQAMTWAEGAFSTILGALILILTGRVARVDGQTASGINGTSSTISTQSTSSTGPNPPNPINSPTDVPKSSSPLAKR